MSHVAEPTRSKRSLFWTVVGSIAGVASLAVAVYVYLVPPGSDGGSGRAGYIAASGRICQGAAVEVARWEGSNAARR